MSIMQKTALFFLFCASLPVAMAADCSREDVDHYLSKGFTPEQIVSLCGDASEAESEEQGVATEAPPSPEPAPPAASSAGEAADSDESQRALDYLGQATRAEKWHIDEEGVLSFSHPVKVVFGEEDVFGNRERVRPYIDVSLKLSELRIVGLSKRIPLLRRGSVTLSGEMWLEAVGEEGFEDDERAAIQAYLEERRTNQTFELEAEPGGDIEQVRRELDRLGRRAEKR